MENLLKILGQWPGRQETKRRLEERGFFLPTRYESAVFEVIGSSNETRWRRYWDEVAMEHICSGGRADSARRQFRGETTYRSEYLDKLADNNKNAEAASQGLSLDPKLRKFDEWCRAKAPSQELNSRHLSWRMEQEKREDLERLSILEPEWSETVSVFEPFFEMYASECGFQTLRSWWRKKRCGGEVEFRFKIDRGRRTTWTFHVPFYSEIFHTTDRTFVYRSDDFLYVTPGFARYAVYESPATGVLGVAALINLFDCIGEAIEDA